MSYGSSSIAISRARWARIPHAISATPPSAQGIYGGPAGKRTCKRHRKKRKAQRAKRKRCKRKGRKRR